jgi:hypothetical protein
MQDPSLIQGRPYLQPQDPAVDRVGALHDGAARLAQAIGEAALSPAGLPDLARSGPWYAVPGIPPGARLSEERSGFAIAGAADGYFARFDADKDDSISRTEFAKLP